MSGNKYLNYTAEEFAADAYFQSWVLERDHMAEVFWKDWLEAHPEKEPDVRLAMELVQEADQFKFKEFSADEEDFNEVWHNIVLQQTNHAHPTQMVESRALRWKWMAAACLILLIAGAVLFQFFQRERTVHFSSGYNETVDHVLPDGSKVILNANSRLSYDRPWEKERKVYLEGEAFFSIVHTVDNKRFTVYANELGVEVLGTEFEVKNRRGKMRVILQSGKVRLNIPNFVFGNRPAEELIMMPGELVEYSEEHKGIMRKKVDTEKYTAWTRNEIVFDNASLEEVAEVIEDHYGYQVRFEDEAIQRRVFTARINDKSDINLLINILQETFNLNIYKNKNDLIIERK